MTGQGSGLRFDIYERVHLPEGLDGIEALEEAELAPHIQVVEESDYAVIKGNLWLTGEYRGEAGSSGQALEHLIPVEITMPLNRIGRLEDIRVEIDQFDVEVISNRSLNVTGVLSLHGLESTTAYDENNWEPQEEDEVVFVYDLQPSHADSLSDRVEVENTAEADLSSSAVMESVQPVEDWTVYNEEQRSIMVQPAWEQDPQSVIHHLYERADSRQELEETKLEETILEEAAPEQAENDNAPAEEVVYSELPVEAILAKPTPKEPVPAEAAQQEQQPNVLVQEELIPEKQEMKVAIVAKPEKEGLSHLHSLVRPPTAAEPAAAQNAADEQKESVQWKKLFVGESKQGAFRKLRICIVQREETIEQIADRYRINPREIVLYNRLPGQQIGEGQILYIPSS